MITPGTIANPLKSFIQESQTKPSSPEAIDAFCQKLEEVIIVAFTKATITIPPGQINVAGVSGPSSNGTPIILEGAIK